MATSSQVRAGHLVAGTIGLALVRHWYVDADVDDRRLDELREVLQALQSGPSDDVLARVLDPVHRDLDVGYAEWAERYDGANPFIDREEEAVRPVLEALASPGVVALDAACGTGRHAAFLAAQGCEVTGVDLSEAMLDVARQKVPDGRFLVGDLRALPLDDGVVDLAVVALALSHLEDPTPALAELARVLRPGGRLVITDPHPASQVVGGQAFYGSGPEGRLAWVRNHYHQASTWLRAFAAVGLTVEDCQEPRYGPRQWAANPTSGRYPEAVQAAYEGLPMLWVWVLHRT